MEPIFKRRFGMKKYCAFDCCGGSCCWKQWRNDLGKERKNKFGQFTDDIDDDDDDKVKNLLMMIVSKVDVI